MKSVLRRLIKWVDNVKVYDFLFEVTLCTFLLILSPLILTGYLIHYVWGRIVDWSREEDVDKDT